MGANRAGRCVGVSPATGVMRRVLSAVIICALLAVMTSPYPVRAATFTPSTTPALIAAILTANSNGADDIVDLGGQTFTLTAVDNLTSGANGLPVVQPDGGHSLTIRNGTIERQSGSPDFRILATATGAELYLDALTISGGVASAGGFGTLGGGLFAFEATVSITNSTFSNNTATGVSGLGAAIFKRLGSLTVDATTFSGNTTATGSGAGLYDNLGTATIINSTFHNNTANFGGGYSNENATSVILNSTFSQNTATNSGGGIYSGFGTVSLVNVTLSGNSSSGPGAGGIDNPNFTGTAIVTVRSTILDTGSTGPNCSADITSLGSNLSDDNSCGFAQTGDVNNATLNLGTLATNGGPTRTHALNAGSAAIDAVQGFCTYDGTFGGTAIPFDQRGMVRPRGAACDAGAYEAGTITTGSLQFSAATFTASEAGPTTAVTVTRTGGSDFQVGATITLANGTATAPADYNNAPITVTFAAGDTTPKSVSIPLVDDAVGEGDETILLTLGSPTGGATLGVQTSATLTITDNDPAPSLSINDVTLPEGNTGTTPFAFTVTLSAASSQTVTVQAQTADGSASAVAGDYAAAGPQTLTFAPGETTKPFTVQVIGDTVNEPTKTFVVNLSGATNATISDSQGVGVITNDDDLPSLSIANVTQAEGNSGTTPFVFAVTLSAVSAQTVTVQAQTADGSATAAAGDYTPAGPTMLTFTPGETSKTFTVQVAGDTVNEAAKTFVVNLTSPTNATILSSQGVGLITNDDGDATISIANATVAEGNSDTTTAQFTVTRTGFVTATATVQYATADGTAKASTDYTATSGTLTFAPNETSKTIAVTVNGDTTAEPDETFTVTLSNPTNAALGTAQAVGIITNDDEVTACGPRPRVAQSVSAGDGALLVRIEATPLNIGGNNPIQQVRFGTLQNATVTMQGKAVSGGQAVPLPANTVAVEFVVRRVTLGQATMVPFTVVDSCGAWETFVGAGAGAGF